MKEIRNIKNFEIEVYSDKDGRLRYSGRAFNMNTRERVNFYYKTKRNGYYNRIGKGENFESLKNRLYTCDYNISDNTVYITR